MSSPERPIAAPGPHVEPRSAAGLAGRGPSLRAFALDCIAFALDRGRPPEIDRGGVPAAWLEPRACFVTLHRDEALRGCMGTFDAAPALVDNVVSTALQSAFADPRFRPVTRPELPQIEVEVSVLSHPEPFPVASREALLEELVPGVDGLIVSEGRRRATFLPAVWESLPEPVDFVEALFRKAGLPVEHWSTGLRFDRYTAVKAD